MNYTGTFFNDVVSLLYPHTCAGCGSDVLQEDALICFNCHADLPVTDFYRQPQNPVEKIFRGRIPVQSCTSHVYFTKHSSVQNLLHQLKYKGNKDVGRLMGTMIGDGLRNSGWMNGVDAVIPLPLHSKKLKKRGYNQAEIIAQGIGDEMGVPVLTDIIVRRRNTETQTQKTRMERWWNIESKFELIKQISIVNRHVLLVDDVITTGATLESCGMELLKAEGTKLSIATFAYTTL